MAKSTKKSRTNMAEKFHTIIAAIFPQLIFSFCRVLFQNYCDCTNKIGFFTFPGSHEPSSLQGFLHHVKLLCSRLLRTLPNSFDINSFIV